MAASPYAGLPQTRWRKRTEKLIRAHPLDPKEIVEVVLLCWNSIFDSKIGAKGFGIGSQIRPKPQIMGFFLHELIPLEFQTRHPNLWQKDKTAHDKDLVYLPDESKSVEIKTSSHPTQIFGNRSYAQPASEGKKSKDGYYLAVNFEKFSSSGKRPNIRGVRFGWLDHSDWIAQKAATGQQARLAPMVYETKLLQLL